VKRWRREPLPGYRPISSQPDLRVDLAFVVVIALWWGIDWLASVL